MSKVIKVHYNPSTLKVQFDIKTKKVIVSSYEYGQDGCCFLDPSIPQWSGVITYNLGDMVWYSEWGCFRSKADNNLNKKPSLYPDWWTKLSDAWPCGNTNWDKWPGYGGFGKTPKYMRVTFSGIGLRDPVYPPWSSTITYSTADRASYGGLYYRSRWDDNLDNRPDLHPDWWAEWPAPSGWPMSGPNRKFVAVQTYHSLGIGWDYYQCQTKPSPQGGYAVFIHFYNNYYAIELWIRRCFKGWINGFYYLTDTYILIGDVRFKCLQNHTATPENQPEDGGNEWWEDLGTPGSCVCAGCIFSYVSEAPNCDIIGASTPNACHGLEGEELDICRGEQDWCYEQNTSDGQGHALIIPGKGQVYSWIVAHDYSVGDLVVGSDSDVFVCGTAHTSSINDRPITGANWETYWYRAGDFCT